MNSEPVYLFVWYLVLQILAGVTFPISYWLFPHFPDRGYTLAKIQGLLFSAYLSWLLASINLLPYKRATAWLPAIGILAISFKLVLAYWKDLLKFFRQNVKLLVLIESLFLSTYLIFTIIRTYNPDITGAEKEPDFTFLNAILRSEKFPPIDTWFAGEFLNYYYFGYFIWAHVIKLTGIPSSIGFNLAIATIIALSVMGAFALGFSLTNQIRYGLLTAFLLGIAGNLDGLIQWLERGRLNPFDWWRSSRVIPDTINEFPFFSFLLGDLHAHFMSIPFTLLFLSLLYEFTFSTTKSTKSMKGVLKNQTLPFYISLGASPFLNTWDFPTYLLLTFLCLFQQQRVQSAEIKSQKSEVGSNNLLFPIFRFLLPVGRVFLTFLIIVIISYLLYLPFHLSFKSQISLTNLRPVSNSQRTGLWYFLVIYGFFLFILGTFAFYRFKQLVNHFSPDARLTLWGGILLSFPILYLIFNTWIIPLTLIFLLLFLLLWLRESQFPYLLIFVATAILIGCELVYIKDFYAHPLERQNTIFKFYYQVWILLSIGIPYLLYEIHVREGERGKGKGESKDLPSPLPFALSSFKTYWDYAFMFLLVAILIYPVAATYEKCNRFKSANQGGVPYIPTLDGIAYIQHRYPQEYKALIWLQENLSGQPVILEATGKPYSFYGRVSANTGFPTVLGWGNHEALWRDQTWKSIMDRTQDIEKIYTIPDKSDAEVWNLLKKYQVQYVYVGFLERQSYNHLGLEGFKNRFKAVYDQDEIIIYKIERE